MAIVLAKGTKARLFDKWKYHLRRDVAEVFQRPFHAGFNPRPGSIPLHARPVRLDASSANCACKPT